MGLWRAEVGDRKNQDGMTSIYVECMHDGCEMPKTFGKGKQKGFIHLFHNEGAGFKMPRGLRFECTYCRSHGTPQQRLWMKEEAA